MNIPNLELFPNRVPVELSQIAFPIIVLPQGDRTDFAQEKRLDLPYWTMILAGICVLVDVSKYLVILKDERSAMRMSLQELPNKSGHVIIKSELRIETGFPHISRRPPACSDSNQSVSHSSS